VLKTERERALYMNISAYAALFAMVAVFTFVVVYMRKKNKALKMQLALNDRLNSMKTQLSDIREETKRKERMIEDVKADLADRETNLMNVGEELQRNEQLLADMKKRLADKMRQSETLMQMLQQAEMEDAAGDVVAAVRKSAEGKKKLSAGEWRQLISAVNSLHPDFKDLLLQRNEGLTEQQVQVCYLMRIGLTGPQINNVVDISRTTVWRWTQAYRWIYSIEDPN
jgi:septal ring factor EnvC (AmiA/AmiB activator)